ncbi:hypothetical protein ACFL02_09885, partial [Planctomycetota bacterium]
PANRGYYSSGSLTLQYSRNRYYDYQTGKWLTHDPWAITPNVLNPDGFSPLRQYRHGMSLNEYVGSRPAKYKDPFGWYFDAPWQDDDDAAECDYWVNCGRILVDSWDEWIADKLGFFHCDLRKEDFDEREDEIRYPAEIDGSDDRELMAGKGTGTPCSQADCSQIDDCVSMAQIIGDFECYGNNCHTATARALSKCCFLSPEWEPSWHAGDWRCVKWVWDQNENSAKHCVEWLPKIAEN